jgi:hypothetical protein
MTISLLAGILCFAIVVFMRFGENACFISLALDPGRSKVSLLLSSSTKIIIS